VENVCSDIFLFILIFLLEKKPFTKSTVQEFEGRKLNTMLINVNRSPVLQCKLIASPNLHSKFSPAVTISRSPMMTKRLTLEKTLSKPGNASTLGANLESKNYLMQFARKDKDGKDSSNNPNSILMRFATGGTKDKSSKTGETADTDENVLIKNIPVNRKKRNDLKNFEKGMEAVEEKPNNYTDLPIMPAVKQKNKKEFLEMSK